MTVGVRLCAPASRWETATFLLAVHKNTDLLVFDLHALLCVNENQQQFPLMPLLSSVDDDGG